MSTTGHPIARTVGQAIWFDHGNGSGSRLVGGFLPSIGFGFQSTPDQLVGRFLCIQSDSWSQGVSIHARPIGRAISRRSNRLISKRKKGGLREPLGERKGWWELEGKLFFQLYKDQMIRRGANLPDFRCHLGFARQTRRGPSKSRDRKTPYCLTRSSWGSVSR